MDMSVTPGLHVASRLAGPDARVAVMPAGHTQLMAEQAGSP